MFYQMQNSLLRGTRIVIIAVLLLLAAIPMRGEVLVSASPSAPTDSPPLPTTCDELAGPGQDPPAACVYGYVYLDGAPVNGATVTLHSEAGNLSLATQPGPGSADPYFAAALSEPPLSVGTGDLVVAEANDSGQQNRTTFRTGIGAQQVDVWLASGCGPTTAGGLIGSDTTWTRECAPYVVSSNVLVQDGVTLTVQSGTEIRFAAGTSLQVDGVLQADGAAKAMIVFTSDASGAPGDWGYILLREMGDVQPFPQLTYALIEYGGGADVENNAALRVDGAWPVLHDLTIRNNDADGVRFWNGAIGTISASDVYSNTGWGVYADSAGLSATNGHLHLHDNGEGGIYLRGSGPVWLSDSVIEDNGKQGVNKGGNDLDLYAYRNVIRGNEGGDGGGLNIGSGQAAIYDSVIMDNDGNQGGGIFCERYAHCTIYGNIIYRNHASQNGGGVVIRGQDIPVHHNVIASNVADDRGGGIFIQDYFYNPSPQVHENALIANQALVNGGAIHLGEDAIEVVTNTIVLNNAGDPAGGSLYTVAAAVVNDNNLYGNAPYDLANGNPQSTPALDAEDNWWNTVDAGTIGEHVWDWFEDGTVGLVDYEPFATGWFLSAPVAPPTGFVAARGADPYEIDVSWAANGETDVAGYQVYYDTDSGYPYDGTGASEGDSPIDVGNVTAFTLSGLPADTFFVTVTAYDGDADGVSDQTDGNESWFAPEEAVGTGIVPIADFIASPASGEAPLTVDFTNQSTGDYATCAWDFGDGGTSTDCSDPQHTYDTSGLYTASLTVTGDAGSDTQTRTDYITVSGPGTSPTADFTADVTGGTIPFVVNFANQSTGLYDVCRWDFGDGATSTDCTPPAHTYYTAGNFHVSLIVRGAKGQGSRVRQAYITANAPAKVWVSHGPEGGSIHDLVMAPSNPDILYAATERGVFKSLDGGGNWSPTNHPALTVRALAVASDNPAIVYSGTDDGVYKSTDGGNIWLHQGLDSARVNALAVRQDHAQVVLAGVGKPRAFSEAMMGVYRSSDGGASWHQVYADPDDDAVMALLVDSDDDAYIYAGIMGEDGVAISDDGGDHWTNQHVGPDEWNDEEVYALAMTPAGAATPTLYAFSVALDADVYKSTNRGTSWAATNTPEWFMADYPAALAVDPVNPQVVYVGVTDYHGQLLRSTNAGGSWTAIQNGMPQGNPTRIVVDPTNRAVFVAQEEGDIYRSGDLGTTWDMACRGLVNTTVEDLALHPDDTAVALSAINGRGHEIAATYDGGGSWSYLSTSPGAVYDASTPAEVGAIAYDPQDARTIYAGDGWGYQFELYLYKSTDGGAGWNEHQVLEIVNGSSYMGTSAIWVHPDNPSTVLVGVAGWGGTDGGGVYRSFDGGVHWLRPLDQWTNALVSDPGNPSIVYAASEQCGRVYRSENAGQGWNSITPATPPDECWVWAVNDLAVDAAGHLLAATSSGLQHWDGATWTEVAGVPAAQLSALAIDRTKAPETIYVGTEGRGVFVSYDGGASWAALNAGLGAQDIIELTLARGPSHCLYASTINGGIWQWQLTAAQGDYWVWLPLITR